MGSGRGAAFGVEIVGVKITVCSLTPSRVGIMTSRLVNSDASCAVAAAVAAISANVRTERNFIGLFFPARFQHSAGKAEKTADQSRQTTRSTTNVISSFCEAPAANACA